MDGLIWGAALRDGLFFRPAVLFLSHVQQAHFVSNALQAHKNNLVAASKTSVSRR